MANSYFLVSMREHIADAECEIAKLRIRNEENRRQLDVLKSMGSPDHTLHRQELYIQLNNCKIDLALNSIDRMNYEIEQNRKENSKSTEEKKRDNEEYKKYILDHQKKEEGK